MTKFYKTYDGPVEDDIPELTEEQKEWLTSPTIVHFGIIYPEKEEETNDQR